MRLFSVFIFLMLFSAPLALAQTGYQAPNDSSPIDSQYEPSPTNEIDEQAPPLVNPLRRSLASCRLVPEVMERLSCYDDTIRHFNVTEKTLQDVDVKTNLGLWTIKSEVSPIDDLQTMYMNLESDDLLALSNGRRVRPLLVVRCNPDYAGSYIVWDTDLGKTGHKQITTRMDRNRSQTLNWVVSNDRSATFHPDPLPFIKELLDHRNLSVEIKPPHEGVLIANFSLDGFNNTVRVIKDTCGW